MLAAASDRNETATALGVEWAQFDRTVEPIAANVDRYQELRSIYREIYAAHANHFRRLGTIQ